jgi:hypothetical protein
VITQIIKKIKKNKRNHKNKKNNKKLMITPMKKNKIKIKYKKGKKHKAKTQRILTPPEKDFYNLQTTNPTAISSTLQRTKIKMTAMRPHSPNTNCQNHSNTRKITAKN